MNEQDIVEQSKKLFNGVDYWELGMLIGLLRALVITQHAYHWQTAGANYYADHTLYERLYTETEEDVDGIAERAVGMGGIELTNYHHQLTTASFFLKAVSHQKPLYEEALDGEKLFIKITEFVMKSLEGTGKLSSGIEQLLGDVLNKHENHVYLLKQRNNSNNNSEG